MIKNIQHKKEFSNIQPFITSLFSHKKGSYSKRIVESLKQNNISVVFDRMPSECMSWSGKNAIYLSSQIPKDISEIDLSYILLHEYFHIIEGVTSPLCLEEKTRLNEKADEFAKNITFALFNDESKYVYKGIDD